MYSNGSTLLYLSVLPILSCTVHSGVSYFPMSFHSVCGACALPPTKVLSAIFGTSTWRQVRGDSRKSADTSWEVVRGSRPFWGMAYVARITCCNDVLQVLCFALMTYNIASIVSHT